MLLNLLEEEVVVECAAAGVESSAVVEDAVIDADDTSELENKD